MYRYLQFFVKTTFYSRNLSVKNIQERHAILAMSIGTRAEEDHSYSRAQVMLPVVVVLFLLGSFIEAAAYCILNYKVLETAFLSVKLSII